MHTWHCASAGPQPLILSRPCTEPSPTINTSYASNRYGLLPAAGAHGQPQMLLELTAYPSGHLSILRRALGALLRAHGLRYHLAQFCIEKLTLPQERGCRGGGAPGGGARGRGRPHRGGAAAARGGGAHAPGAGRPAGRLLPGHGPGQPSRLPATLCSCRPMKAHALLQLLQHTGL